jgi:hypothetical protein
LEHQDITGTSPCAHRIAQSGRSTTGQRPLQLSVAMPPRPTRPRAPSGVALVCFGLLFAATVTLGRASLGLGDAGRYTPFVLLIPVGSYLALCGRPEALPEAKSPGTSLQVIRATLVGAICLQAVFGIGNGLAIGREWHQSQLLTADVTVNIDLAPNDLVQRTLLPSVYLAGYVRQMTQVAKTHHLSLFATNAVALFTKEGLPWRAAAGMPEGLVMDLAALASLGRGQRGWGAVRRETESRPGHAGVQRTGARQHGRRLV